jgi:hypothetical protein
MSVCNNTDDPINQVQVELLIEPKGLMAVSEDWDLPDPAMPGCRPPSAP